MDAQKHDWEYVERFGPASIVPRRTVVFQPYWNPAEGCWMCKDAGGTDRYAEPESKRRRLNARDLKLWMRAAFNELDNWIRIDLHPLRLSDLPWFRPQDEGIRALAQGDPLHITLVLNGNMNSLTPQKVADIALVRNWFAGHTYEGFVRISYVSGFTMSGGFVAHLRGAGILNDTARPDIMPALRRLRATVGEHGGGPMTVSL